MQHVDEFIYRLPRSKRQIPSRGISLLLNIILALILIGLATILGIGVVKPAKLGTHHDMLIGLRKLA